MYNTAGLLVIQIKKKKKVGVNGSTPDERRAPLGRDLAASTKSVGGLWGLALPGNAVLSEPDERDNQ